MKTAIILIATLPTPDYDRCDYLFDLLTDGQVLTLQECTTDQSCRDIAASMGIPDECLD